MNKDKLALVNEKELSLIEDNSLNRKQLQLILQKTPSQYVKKRPAKGGGEWEYVTGGYVKKCLNLMFGWRWSFEIIDEKIMIEAKEVVVKGRLTCHTIKGEIVKMQYGNKDIMFRKNSKIPLSIGNDMKAAATDCLKKCAAEIGIAADIYNKEDFREVKVEQDNSLTDFEIKKRLELCKDNSEMFELWEQLTESQQRKYDQLFNEKKFD